jgi:hypothetical protein
MYAVISTASHMILKLGFGGGVRLWRRTAAHQCSTGGRGFVVAIVHP